MSAYDSLSSSSSTDVPDGGAIQITFNDVEEDTISEETVDANLDEYVSASKGGRQAFARGDLPTATREFSQALDIELQTEMDCLYDNNIGYVSGLVRRGVDSRLGRSPRHQPDNCAKILNRLMETYEKANKKISSKPTQAKWYLEMGAALCIINEWEKAKSIYTEGINMCKDKKDLKHALKQLTEIERITSSAEIPDEDGAFITPQERRNGARNSKDSPRSSPRHSPNIQRRAKRKVIRERSLSTVANKPRSNSESKDEVDVTHVRDVAGRKRAGSLTLPKSPSSEQSRGSEYSLPISKLTVQNGKKDKRFSLNIFSNKRHSVGLNALFGIGSKNHAIPTISNEERQSWRDCFSPTDCSAVSGYREFVPSAVTHMRHLASLSSTSGAPASSPSEDGGEEMLDIPFEPRMSFSAVKFESMKIDSDDSELDDD